MQRAVIGIAALAMLLSIPAAARGQGSGEAPRPASDRRPFRGIFSGLSTPQTPQSLVLGASLFGAYDDNVLAGVSQSNSSDTRLQRSGSYWGAVGSLQYTVARTAGRFSLGGNAGGALRYYRGEDFSNASPDAAAGGILRYRISRSTNVGVSHQFAYTPHYRFYLVPTAGEGPAEDLAITLVPELELFNLAVLRNTTSVSLTQSFGRHASVSAGYNLRLLHFLDDETPDRSDEQASANLLRSYRTQSGSVRFQYSKPFTTHAVLNLGYGVRISDADLGSGEPQTMHEVLAGIGYSRALSVSRRTSVSFSTGSAFAATEPLGEPEAEARTRLRLTGTAALNHELGRTWSARVFYQRGFVFHEGFNEPFFTDSVSVSLGGLATRRLSLWATGTWAVSDLNRPGRSGQTSGSANAQSTYALSRLLALYAQYIYYYYDFDAGLSIDHRFPRSLNRQGVRIGLTASVPLLR